MHHQHLTGRNIHQQIFGAAAEPAHGLTLQPLGEVIRQRPAQVAAMRHHLLESRAFHYGRKPAADGFDFREFGHYGRLPSLCLR